MLRKTYFIIILRYWEYLDCESGRIWPTTDCKKGTTTSLDRRFKPVNKKRISVAIRWIWYIQNWSWYVQKRYRFRRTGRRPFVRTRDVGDFCGFRETGCNLCLYMRSNHLKMFMQKVQDQETKDLTLSSWIEQGGGNACYASPEMSWSRSSRRRSSMTPC